MKPKSASNENSGGGWLQDLFENIEAERGTPIAERWYVVEVTPPKRYSYDNGHGGVEYKWTDQKYEKVSPYFAAKEGAETWMEDYVPDEGNRFEIRSQTLYEKVTRTWH